jgi:glycosyltransferase involved in cell wall biosynthesis
LRVALLTNFIPPYRVPLYEALVRESGELRVFVCTDMESNRQWLPERGTLDVVHQRTLTVRHRWRTPEFSEPHELHIPYDTWQQLRRWRADVILTGELGARSLQAVAYARSTRTPVVIWAMLSDRLENGRGRVRTAARRWLARNADSIIVNGESGARYFHRLGTPDDRLLRVHQAVDMRALLALPLERSPQHEYHLLHVGTLSERKGVHMLLAAVHRWAEANPATRVTLTLVGDGPLRSKLAERSMSANLTVHWAGSVPYNELPRWYASGGVLLFPSLGDEWGLVVNEALAAGVPIAGSAYSQAVEELVRDSLNGWVFVPEDEKSIFDVLDRIFATGPERLHDMRVAARESVRALTSESAAARIATCLQAVAAR